MVIKMKVSKTELFNERHACSFLVSFLKQQEINSIFLFFEENSVYTGRAPSKSFHRKNGSKETLDLISKKKVENDVEFPGAGGMG